MAKKTVTCRTCGRPVLIDARARITEYFCGDDCRPRCDYPGCTTPAAGIGSRCWHHRERSSG
jgi:hypothetical protein